ncbi:MAG TPA: dienelactone hydrolase family protein [Polyangiales bacterium]
MSTQTRATQLGYLAWPTVPVRGALVVVHDVWGLYDHFRDIAQRLAREGYATLALELYRRQPPVRIDDPGAFMRELSDSQVLQDIQTAVDFLHAQPELADKRVGVVGFCMGGMYALLAGCSLRSVAAVVPFYGILSHAHGLLHASAGLDPAKKPRAPLQAAAELRCPLLAFFGDSDPFIPVSDIEALRAQLQRQAQPATLRVFAGAGHAFMNDTRPAAYKPELAKLAWQQMLEFLAQHVGPAAP